MFKLGLNVRSHRVLAAPPLRTDGVANMLVALGEAGIGVRQVERRVDDRGTYFLTVDRRPGLAIRILEGIGCKVETGVSPSPAL